MLPVDVQMGVIWWLVRTTQISVEMSTIAIMKQNNLNKDMGIISGSSSTIL